MSPGGRIKESDVETVRERTDIVQLISEYIPLKKSGREFRGPCPFHQEKDPSFYVNPSKGVYYCFGCQASGGAFNFVMQLEGLNFNESVERLADRMGYQLTYEAASPQDTERRTERDRLFKLNETAAEFYHYVLVESKEGKTALEYLNGRGFGAEIIEQFKLGFAPPGWGNASTFLTKKGFTERELVTAGLARERSGAGTGGGERRVYDVFRDRVMFPIFDHRGRVVAFGGRIMPGDRAEGEPKYLNSPETPVYRKGHTLYGFFQSRASVQDTREAVVVEGYTDLLALWQAGVTQVVASLGTALTENHFDLLNRFCEKAYLAFDADRAGQEAAVRPLAFWNRFSIEVLVITMPMGEDPASLVEKGGREAFEKYREGAVPLIEFAARRLVGECDTSTPVGRRRAMEACLPVLSKVAGDDMRPIRDDLVRKIGGWLEMPEETVLVFLRESSRAKEASAGRPLGAARSPAMWEKVEKEAMRLLLHDPGELLDHPYLDEDYFIDPALGKIFGMLKEITVCDEEVLQADYNSMVGRLVAEIEDEQVRAKATRLLMESPPDCSPGDEDKVFDRLSCAYYKRLKQKTADDLRRVNKKLEPKKYDELFRRLLDLDQVIKEQFPYDHT